MERYRYQARNGAGKRLQGVHEAENPEALLRWMEERGLFCIRWEPAGEARVHTTYKMKLREVVLFCRQLETMLQAGITVARVFEILRDRTEKPPLRKLYGNILESVQKGVSLSEAMAREGSSFPKILLHMIRVGEVSGSLDGVTRRMASHFTNEMKINTKLKNAMIYPVVLLVVTMAVVVLIFSFVLPQLFSLFEGMELPWNTKLLMDISYFLQYRWYVLVIVLVLLVAGIQGLLASRGGRIWWDRAKTKLPLVGKMLRIVYTSRFARSMATLYASGVPVMECLDVSRDLIGNAWYREVFASVIGEVGSGHTLAGSLEKAGLFDPIFYSMVYVGEESGSLEHLLGEVSDYYENEASVALERMMALLEPALMVVLAVVIGFILVSVIVPMYQSYSYIG